MWDLIVSVPDNCLSFYLFFTRGIVWGQRLYQYLSIDIEL